MDFDDYIGALAVEGQRFSVAIAAVPTDTPVPTCPEWTMRDLVHHQGEVHRWATAVVANSLTQLSAVPPDFRGPLPADDELVEWFDDGVAGLIAALQSADPDVAIVTFLADPPPPRVFWARRQTHETCMHRIDAESAVGEITPVSTSVAADGIDEMLTGFVPRRHTPLHRDPSVSMQVELIDDDGRWHVTIGDGPPTTIRGTKAADCTVRGPADDIYRALWNRRDVDGLQIEGDSALLEEFRGNVKIRWG